MTDEEKAYATSQMRAAIKELQAEHSEEIAERDRDMRKLYEENCCLRQQAAESRETLRALQAKHDALAIRLTEAPQHHREVIEHFEALAKLINNTAVIACEKERR